MIHRLDVPTAEGTLHAFLVLPSGTETPPLVVGVHGGPRPPMDGEIALREAQPWLQAGLAYLATDYRASGVLGQTQQERVLSGADVPGPGADAADVERCVRTLLAGPLSLLVDDSRRIVYGFSYGAYVVNRWVTWAEPHPSIRAVICHEGVADLWTLDDASMQIQADRRGSTPSSAPEHWSEASPIDRADRVRHPMTLIYGDRSPAFAQGQQWRHALENHAVPVTWREFAGQGHVFSTDAMYQVAAGIAAELEEPPEATRSTHAER